MPVADEGSAQAADVARTLVGSAVELNRVIGGGRNSRIWRVRSRLGVFALKQYPARRDDQRDRLLTEVGALRLMERHHVDSVPRVVGVDARRGYALLSWIDGADVLEISNDDIDAAANFLGAIHNLRAVPCAAQQPLAAEACLSGAEILRQVEERLTKLRGVASNEEELIDFLKYSFAGQFTRWSTAARDAGRQAGLDFDGELPQEYRSLVPSDFGFHNSLRRSGGSLAFVDFEYFGWDDPVKMTADILLHPGRTLRPAQRDRFRQAATHLYSDNDQAFAARLSAYLPLFGCRWVLIMLNEFIPELWRRRALAGDSGGWREAKMRQLGKARDFLSTFPQKCME